MKLVAAAAPAPVSAERERALDGPVHQPGSTSPRTGRAIIALVLLLGVTLLAAGASAVILSPGGQGAAHRHPAAHRSGSAPALRDVGPAQVAPLQHGTGLARLDVSAETARGGVTLDAVPVGAPVRLKLTLDGAGRSGAASLLARTRGGVPIDLDRSETFVFRRASGELIMPSPGLGASASGHAGQHASAGVPQPGEGLAQNIKGGGFAAEIKLPDRATSGLADDAGRFFAAAYGNGTVRFADLLRHAQGGGVELGGSPGTMAFAPDGRLWVADARAARVTVVDPAGPRIVGRLAVPAAAGAIAFDGRAHALVAAGSAAALIDAGALREIRRVPLPDNAVGAAFASAEDAFVVAADGAVTVVPAAGGARRSIRLGADLGTRSVAIGPDGRTAVTANERDSTMSVVDLRRSKVRTIKAGKAPTEVVMLGKFALARNAKSADITWVDLETPSRSNNLQLAGRPASDLTIASNGDEALAASPQERTVFVVHPMMGRPMVMEQIPNSAQADVAIRTAGGLQRTGATTLEERTTFPEPGRYHVELRLAGGRRAEFTVPVTAHRAGAPQARPLTPRMTARAGAAVVVRFRVSGATPADAQVVASRLGTASSALRLPARAIGGGIYEARIAPPIAGRYRLALSSEQSGILAASGESVAARLDVR